MGYNWQKKLMKKYLLLMLCAIMTSVTAYARGLEPCRSVRGSNNEVCIEGSYGCAGTRGSISTAVQLENALKERLLWLSN